MSSGLLSSRADMMPELTNREIMIQEHQKSYSMTGNILLVKTMNFKLLDLIDPFNKHFLPYLSCFL